MHSFTHYQLLLAMSFNFLFSPTCKIGDDITSSVK